MDPQTAPDDEVMAEAARGAPWARRELVRRYRGEVYRFLTRLTRDPVQAEDLLQDTFVAALAAVGSWRGEGPVRGWLYAIARHRLLMAQRGPRRVGGDEAPLLQLGLEAGWGAPMDPEALTARLEAQAVLERALATLDEEARAVVTLRDLEGLSGEETAAALGLSVAAMKSRLHRARLQLMAAVKRAGGTHG